MRRLAIATAAAACLAAPTAASAAPIFVIKGAGFGHGVGMSQYGAYGYAQHGTDYRTILAHYYSGTDIGSAPTKTIRVLLRSGSGTVTVSHAGRVGSHRLDPAKTYVARARGAGVQLSPTSRGRSIRTSGKMRIRGAGGWFQSGSAYRGTLELVPSGGTLTSVNVLSLDNYVKGVVPGEMPASWPAEALKVQAVAARTYALATDAGGALFDQYADTRSQMYRGMSAEQPSTNTAVTDTSGEVVTYQGAIVTTYYFSTSGGRTENVENVFYGAQPEPYLKSVEDPYDDASPRHRWQFRYTRSQLGAKLGSLCRGSFRRIKVVQRGVSPRVVSADVVCSGGTTRTTGSTLRFRLGLYDSWFRVVRATSSASRVRERGGVPAVSALVRPRTIQGRFTPAPRDRLVDVERRTAGRWVLVAHGRTNSVGQYRVPVYGAGTYRVTADGVSADPLTLR